MHALNGNKEWTFMLSIFRQVDETLTCLTCRKHSPEDIDCNLRELTMRKSAELEHLAYRNMREREPNKAVFIYGSY